MRGATKDGLSAIGKKQTARMSTENRAKVMAGGPKVIAIKNQAPKAKAEAIPTLKRFLASRWNPSTGLLDLSVRLPRSSQQKSSS